MMMPPPSHFLRAKALAAGGLLWALGMLGSLESLAQPAPVPTRANVSYGPHPHQLLDVYLPPGAKGPSAALIWYGGIWVASKDVPDLGRFFPHNCALISVETRTMRDGVREKAHPPVSLVLEDACRAVQFLRLHAAEWNIDPRRIGVAGGSQANLPALFVACGADRANPQAADPVERVSTRVLCAGCWRPGASLTIDPKRAREWVPPVEWGAPAWGCSFPEALQRREELLPEIKRWSPDWLVNQDSPPIYLEFNWGLSKPEDIKEMDYQVHSPSWGLNFQRIAREHGATCDLRFPGHPSEKYADVWDFLVRTLESGAR